MNAQQELIIEKAIQLFGKYGVKVITMDDLARHCGMSKKTIYQLFESKDDVIQTVIAHLTISYTQSYNGIRKQYISAIDEVLASIEIVEKAFKQINPRFLNEISKYHYHAWQKINSFRETVILDFIKSNLRNGQEQGCYHKCFDSEIIASMRLRELNSLHGSYEDVSERYRLQLVLTQVAFHYLAGIVTPEGAQFLKEKYLTIYPSDTESTIIK